VGPAVPWRVVASSRSLRDLTPSADFIPHTRGATMRYLCLMYYDESKHAALSRGEAEALAAEARDCVEELRRAGHYIASDALQSVRTATTLRPGNGRFATTDGP